ncbi:MAG: hypothetical protein ACREID_04380, partial [Planctomycetota bacterium]
MKKGGGWSRIEVCVQECHTDAAGLAALRELDLAGLAPRAVRVHQVYYLEGVRDAGRIALEVLVDPVCERGAVDAPIPGTGTAVSVWKRPGVMDPAEASILRALRAAGDPGSRATTGRTFWIEADAPAGTVLRAVARSLANEVVDEIGLGPVPRPRDLPRAG